MKYYASSAYFYDKMTTHWPNSVRRSKAAPKILVELENPTMCKDGNGSGSVRVECMGTQNRNPNLKPEPDPNIDSGQNSSPKPKPDWIPETRFCMTI